MPYTLAHPAMVVPLRRWKAGLFSYRALVVGSIVPDLAAAIDDWEYFSHTLAGSVVFCLPVGLLTLWLVQQLARYLVDSLPSPHREYLLPDCESHRRATVPAAFSILIASWGHIAWDLLTHDHSPLLQEFTFLSARFAGLPFNRWLWFVSTVAGVGYLAAVYCMGIRDGGLKLALFGSSERRAYARWAVLLLLPLVAAIPLAINDVGPQWTPLSLIRPTMMFYQGCLYLLLCVTGYALKRRRAT